MVPSFSLRLAAILLLLLLRHWQRPRLGCSLFAAAWKTKQSSCRLPCRNQGVCMTGQASYDGKFAGAKEPLPGASRDQYCSCPRGFTGVLCEIRFVTCGGGYKDAPKPKKNHSSDDDGEDDESGEQHTCFNGEMCLRDIDNNGTAYYHCECDAAGSDLSTAYASRFCQHEATVFCGQDTDRKSLGTAGGAFCTNGGRCKEEDLTHKSGKTPNHRHHPGCICTDQWTGPHCETPTKETIAAQKALQQAMQEAVFAAYADTQRGRFTWWYGCAILVIMVAIAAFVMLRNRRHHLEEEEDRRRRREERRALRRNEKSKKSGVTIEITEVRPVGGSKYQRDSAETSETATDEELSRERGSDGSNEII